MEFQEPAPEHRMPVKHRVKSHPEPFSAVWYGEKCHEIRINDRQYKNQETVRLEEFLPEKNQYTGRAVDVIITYVSREGSYGLQPGHVTFDFLVLNHYGIAAPKSIFKNTNQRPPLTITENPED